jgi:hypothetical protein
MSEFAIPGLMTPSAPIYEATPCVLQLEAHDSSNTNWIGIASIGPILINGEAPPLPASRVLLELFPPFGSEQGMLIFDSEDGADGTASIDDAATWEFVIPVQPLPAIPGLWRWRFRVITPDEATTTIYRGQLLVR